MFFDYFYHQSIRKTVAVFGTLFNNLTVVRKDSSGKVLKIDRVPLAYGPKQKFLSRIDQAESYNDPRIAIKLPRMSFEITSFSYDSATKLNKNTTTRYNSSEGKEKSTGDYAVGPVMYNMGIQLSVYTKTQDDVLQLLEQIIPYFQPQYTVTVKELNDSVSSDYPFVLTAVSFEDVYEGDYESRRAIIYTLDFETKVRFYGDRRHHPLIKKSKINYYADETPDNLAEFSGGASLPFDTTAHIVMPWVADEQDAYDIVKINSTFIETQHIADVVLDTAMHVNIDDAIVTETNGTVGKVINIIDNTISVYGVDGHIDVGEKVYIVNNPHYVFTVMSVNKRWQ